MKKFGKCTVQFFVFVVTYIVIVSILASIASFLYDLLISIENSYRIFNILYLKNIAETILYTFYPFMSAVIIIFIMKCIFKDRIYDGSIVAIFSIVGLDIIFQMYIAISVYGVISWDTANVLWKNIILCCSLWFGFRYINQLNDERSIKCDDLNIPNKNNYTVYADGNIEDNSENTSKSEANNYIHKNDIKYNNSSKPIFITVIIILSILLIVAITYISYQYNEIDSLNNSIESYKSKIDNLNNNISKIRTENSTYKNQLEYIYNFEDNIPISDFYSWSNIIVVDAYGTDDFIFVCEYTGGNIYWESDNYNISIELENSWDNGMFAFTVRGLKKGCSTITFSNDVNDYTENILVIVK